MLSLLDYKHLTIDIETLGTNPDSAIVAIGARLWSRDGLTQGFECYISEQDSLKYGCAYRDTMDWWAKQDPDVYRRVMGGKLDTPTALRSLFQFVDMHKPDYVWANSPAFDLVMLQQVTRSVNNVQTTLRWPFSFRAERCSRTLRALGDWLGVDLSGCYGEMKAHMPLDDATADAKACRMILLHMEQLKKKAYDTAHPGDESPSVLSTKLGALAGPDL